MPQGRPRIGVIRWEELPGERIEDYWQRIEEAGGEAIDLHGPPTDIATLDGLILTGGFDIAPERYGDTPHAKTRPSEPERDTFEIELLRNALADDLPETLAPGLTPTATSPDGIVEAVESGTHRWVLGVQWHPERPEPDHPHFAIDSRHLFQALVHAAQKVTEGA